MRLDFNLQCIKKREAKKERLVATIISLDHIVYDKCNMLLRT